MANIKHLVLQASIPCTVYQYAPSTANMCCPVLKSGKIDLHDTWTAVSH